MFFCSLLHNGCQYNVVKVTLLDWCLDIEAASYLDVLMVNYLVLHLEFQIETEKSLMKELIWVLQMDPLMVLMKAKL